MSQFGFETEGIDLVHQFSDRVKGCTFAITGPSAGGIGAETAVSLAHGHPACLILIGRALDRIQPTIDAIHSIDSSIDVRFIQADLSSLSGSRNAARTILDDTAIPNIDVLINNAAVMACPYTLTPDNKLELQLAAGHLGHFVLTNHLLPKLLPSPSGPPDGTPRSARVINVSSVGNKAGGIRWSDPNFTLHPDEYSEFAAYGQAKTANVLFSIELNRRFAARGLRSWALHPGSISTGLQKHITPDLVRDATLKVFGTTTPNIKRKTLQQGCATTIRAALDPQLENEEGVFLNDCQLTTDPTYIAPWALDKEDAQRLWGWSEQLVGETF
ncbi:short-chain dehydrogenase [Diplogelasinospora grovesii]|uniref:Short-chain dehydrogenase n=1 Tax=Diplogelasinospora grovesii TaxID=303347 RepID=A0AAN6NJE9_9PEZI|nr:short-chain dehydrogenase [Diplogelasinospora grovesii]